MAKKLGNSVHILSKPKKTRQGNSGNTKRGNKGGGPGGSTKSKLYRKRYRGQGK